MGLLARMLRYLFWVLVVYWLWVLARHVISWMLGSRGAQGRAGAETRPREVSRRLHRDPVCGLHVAEEISFPLREGGTTLYFCSEQCRARYAASRGMAASG